MVGQAPERRPWLIAKSIKRAGSTTPTLPMKLGQGTGLHLAYLTEVKYKTKYFFVPIYWSKFDFVLSERPGPPSFSGRHHTASTSSAGYGHSRSLTPKARPTLEQQVQELKCRLNSMNQENRVLRVELDTYKLRCKTASQETKSVKERLWN